jgi:hypothetical protein
MNDQVNQEVTLEEAKKEKVIIICEDGVTRNFGVRTKVLSKHDLTDNGLTVTFAHISGKVANYVFTSETDLPVFIKEAFAFGLESKVKNSLSTKFDDEQTWNTVLTKIEEFNAGRFVNRVTGAVDVEIKLLQIEQAWAKVQAIDVSTTEGLSKVRDYFETLTDEQKEALKDDKDIKVAICDIKLENLLQAKKALLGE